MLVDLVDDVEARFAPLTEGSSFNNVMELLGSTERNEAHIEVGGNAADTLYHLLEVL